MRFFLIALAVVIFLGLGLLYAMVHYGQSDMPSPARLGNIEPAVKTQIFDSGEYDGALYIAMEYVKGRDLGVILRQEGALAYARAGRRQEAAHEASVLLGRLPATDAHRAEVERLLAAVK